MKSLILVLVLMVCSCYDSVGTQCETYTDVCSNGGSDVYSVCADEYGSWFEVYGTTYYTAAYLLSQECGY